MTVQNQQHQKPRIHSYGDVRRIYYSCVEDSDDDQLIAVEKRLLTFFVRALLAACLNRPYGGQPSRRESLLLDTITKS